MTNQEIKELAGHREVPPWVMKLVADAVAMEREACAQICELYSDTDSYQGGITTEFHAIMIRKRGEA